MFLGVRGDGSVSGCTPDAPSVLHGKHAAFLGGLLARRGLPFEIATDDATANADACAAE